MFALRSLSPNYKCFIFKNNRFLSCTPKLVRFDSIKNILQEKSETKTVFQVNGWVRKVFKLKTNCFVHLDDGISPERLQVVIPKSILNDQRLLNGQALTVRGQLVPSSGSKQAFELLCDSFNIVGDCDYQNYKIGHMSTINFDSLREQIHMRPRVRFFQAMNRVRSQAMLAIQMFMTQNDFIQVNTPMITANDCEGGGECFPLHSNNHQEYFGRKTFLTVSGQLHLETMAAAHSKVWNLGPVFRAEKSMSPKHLSEFLMLEVEESFLNKLNPLLDRTETLIKFIAMFLEQRCEHDLKYIREINKFGSLNIQDRFKRITFEDAIEILTNSPEFKDKEITHLNSKMEQALVQIMGNIPVFVTHYPSNQKPFYMKSDDNSNSLSFDLLLPIVGEVAGGSLREDSYEKLQQNIQHQLSNQTNHQQLEWYLDLRKFGHAPTGGFGIGFDRLIQALTGTANIKDVVPFPRWPYHCYL